MKRFQEQHGIDLRGELVARARIVRAAEEAKKKLSFEPYATVQEEFVAEKGGKPLHLTAEVARHEFESLIRPLLDKTIACVGKALDDAQLTPAQLDKVLLVGGSTRSPIISQLLEDRLGMPAHQEVHPDLCVALGAGVQGAMIAGIDAGPVLVDITPHSLGVRCVGLIDGIPTDRKFSVIIPRNTALPVTRSEVYYTCVDNQESVTIEVYQGEHVDATKNVLVGEFHVEGLSEVPAGNEIVDSMTLNLDGVLDVSATEKRTGRRGQIRIENALSRFRREEREAARQRLDELFDRGAVPASISAGAAATDAPSADPSPTPDLEHAVVQFQDLIERGERLLPHASPEDRTEIQTRIANLRQAIAERCETLAREESERLAEVLFFIEETTAAN